MKTRYLLIVTTITACCTLPAKVFSQTYPVSSSTSATNGPPPPPDNPVDVPVDGGLSLLAVAGVAYGIKKIKDYRKKN